MAAENKTFLDDQESLKALVELMPAEDREEYKGYGALSLESTFPGRKMVAYICARDGPKNVETITFEEFAVDWETGPNFMVQCAGGKVQVLTAPKKLRPFDVYMHVPQNFVLKYRGRRNPGKGVDFVSHYAVLIKTRSKEIHQVEGHAYVVTLNNFRERFPALNHRY
jgi:hypothetical protein